MVRSGAISGRASLARLYVNGELVGVYVNVEQVDKRFLTGGRVYIPWDLDTTMNDVDLHVFDGGVGGQTSMYTDALFSSWRSDYEAIIADLVGGSLSLQVVMDEIDRVEAVATDALDGDPYATGSTAATIGGTKSGWTDRHAAVSAQLP